MTSISICDRCKKEIKYSFAEFILSAFYGLKKILYVSFENVELCFNCKKEFKRWLKNESN